MDEHKHGSAYVDLVLSGLLAVTHASGLCCHAFSMIASMLGHCTTDRSGLQKPQIKRHEIYSVLGGPTETKSQNQQGQKRVSPFSQILLAVLTEEIWALFRCDVVHDKGRAVDVGLQ
jgi:hypothetical protein